MTDNGFPDALEKVIGALNTALPLAYVGDELPPRRHSRTAFPSCWFKTYPADRNTCRGKPQPVP